MGHHNKSQPAPRISEVALEVPFEDYSREQKLQCEGCGKTTAVLEEFIQRRPGAVPEKVCRIICRVKTCRHILELSREPVGEDAWAELAGMQRPDKPPAVIPVKQAEKPQEAPDEGPDEETINPPEEPPEEPKEEVQEDPLGEEPEPFLDPVELRREIIRLRETEGMTYRDIAETLGTSYATVAVTVNLHQRGVDPETMTSRPMKSYVKEIEKLHREGFSKYQITKKLKISPGAVYYHVDRLEKEDKKAQGVQGVPDGSGVSSEYHVGFRDGVTHVLSLIFNQ